jgi:hypothetical protein
MSKTEESVKAAAEYDSYIKKLLELKGIKTNGDLAKIKIPCKDSCDGEIHNVNLCDLLKDINITEDDYMKGKIDCIHEELIINGKRCKISFYNGHYCGYVLDDIENDYIPHGGFTAEKGFDCAHSGDISLNIVMLSSLDYISSFKTRKYVYAELEKMTSSKENDD